jgi:Zn finger protein HypA/HybF involved in hydrogenase expression
MRALRLLPEEEEATIGCACCGTPVPYRVAAAPRPRCVSCPTCGYKYRLVVRPLPGGALTVQPQPL